MRGLGEAPSPPGLYHRVPPFPSLGTWGSPSPFPSLLPRNFIFSVTVCQAGTLLSGAPDHPAGEKKDRWAFCFHF